MSDTQWSAPYYGIQHYKPSGRSDSRAYWATVTDRGTWADCMISTPGCGFNPERSDHDSAEAARQYAESRLRLLMGGAHV